VIGGTTKRSGKGCIRGSMNQSTKFLKAEGGLVGYAIALSQVDGEELIVIAPSTADIRRAARHFGLHAVDMKAVKQVKISEVQARQE
jgi:hypothetical protein